MATIEFASTIIGDDEVGVLLDLNSRMAIWFIANSAITVGRAVRLVSSASGMRVEQYTYSTTPDASRPPIGVALSTVTTNNIVLIAMSGVVPSSITGLSSQTVPTPVIVSTTGALVATSTPADTDWIIGTV